MISEHLLEVKVVAYHEVRDTESEGVGAKHELKFANRLYLGFVAPHEHHSREDKGDDTLGDTTDQSKDHSQVLHLHSHEALEHNLACNYGVVDLVAAELNNSHVVFLNNSSLDPFLQHLWDRLFFKFHNHRNNGLLSDHEQEAGVAQENDQEDDSNKEREDGDLSPHALKDGGLHIHSIGKATEEREGAVETQTADEGDLSSHEGVSVSIGFHLGNDVEEEQSESVGGHDQVEAGDQLV